MWRNVTRNKPYAKATGLTFWNTVNFETSYFLNEETKGVLNDTRMNFHDWHLQGVHY